jgi:predicted acetyltransferase
MPTGLPALKPLTAISLSAFPTKAIPASPSIFFANTPEAYRGLLSVLHYHATQLKKATWTAPIDDPLPLHVMHHDLQTTTVPLFMGRIVDIAAAFENLRDLPARGRVILAVDDPACDWNAGAFALDIDGGRVSVKRSTEPAGVALDIQTLSQAYWGHPSLEILRRAGRVSVTDERQFELLARILPPAVCYLQDFF